MMNDMKAEDVLRDAFQRHRDVLEKSETIRVAAARGAELLSKVLKSGKKVFACGNGGSAADPEHFIGELLCKYKTDRKPLPPLL